MFASSICSLLDSVTDQTDLGFSYQSKNIKLGHVLSTISLLHLILVTQDLVANIEIQFSIFIYWYITTVLTCQYISFRANN